jgi:myo-inositol-1(or 4)-monophosphatase
VSAIDLLEVAREAALEAGELLRARFEAGPEAHVASKTSPTDPVSDADLASQHSIRGSIAARRPHDAFLGEEEGADQRGSSGLRWIVDPLDGTVNYLYGIPQWSVSIAVADARGALAGVVHNPISGEICTAVRGGPATHNGVPMPHARNHPPLSQALVATGFAYDAQVREQQGQVLSRLLPAVRDIRRFGSAALDLAWTATGRYDAYYERGVKLWDVAAGVLICECAGLLARDLAHGGVLVAPPSLLDQLAAIVDAERP